MGPSDLDRVRANIAFWSGRSRANALDFVSSTRWAASEIDLARATGDVSRYLAADDALDAALEVNPGYRPALGYHGAVLIALHAFGEAADNARGLLDIDPSDPVALATLGDASLALGEMDTARGAYQQLALVADSAATRVRRSHLAFVDGDPDEAVSASRAAAEAAVDEGHEGSALAWYRYQLGDTLAATGDLEGAHASFEEALRDDANSPLAHWGLASRRRGRGLGYRRGPPRRGDRRDPLPEYVARRADIYRLRGAPGDDRREREDRRTVLAISQLAGEAARSTTARFRSICRPLARTRLVPCGWRRPSSSPARTSTATMPSPGPFSRTAAPTRPGRRWRRRWRWAPGTRSCCTTLA